jgi:uncharacterized protein
MTASPCVRNCCLNDDDICLGCFRTLEEIVGWNEADNQQRRDILQCRDILQKTRQRRHAHVQKFGGKREMK